MESRSHGAYPIVIGVRVNPIGQQDDHQPSLRIDSQRRAGESGMAEGLRRKQVSAGTWCQLPAQTSGARQSRRMVRGCHGNRRRTEHARTLVEIHRRQREQVRRAGKEARVTADPTQGVVGIAVVYLAHQDIVPPAVERLAPTADHGLFVAIATLGCRDARPERRGWQIAGVD